MQVMVGGLTRPEEARALVAAGVDFARLDFAPGSPYVLDLAAARAVRQALGQVMPIGVFADQPLPFIVETAQRLGLTWIQLQGREPLEQVVSLAGRFSVVCTLSLVALKTADTRTLGRHIAAYRVTGLAEGEHAPWAWHKVHGPTISHRPIWLAGGLDPDNVAAAVTAARPAGVEAIEGVRRDGALDPERLQAFVTTARATWEALPPEPT